MPEIVDEGVTGFVVRLDRRGGRRGRAGCRSSTAALVRAVFEQRFSADRMVDDYEADLCARSPAQRPVRGVRQSRLAQSLTRSRRNRCSDGNARRTKTRSGRRAGDARRHRAARAAPAVCAEARRLLRRRRRLWRHPRHAATGCFATTPACCRISGCWSASRTPSLLGASLSQDNIVFTANLTNLPLTTPDGSATPQGVIHIERSRLLWEDRMYERHHACRTTASARRRRAADARLRGRFPRHVRGARLDAQQARPGLRRRNRRATACSLRYDGLDELVRRSMIAFSLPPERIFADHADFDDRGCRSAAASRCSSRSARTGLPRRAASASGRPRRGRAGPCARKRRHGATVFSSGRVFNDWLSRARADIALLTTDLPTGPYPYAGIPWFSTAFGRDGVISALQMLWLNPALARGVLSFLAQHQATETSPFSDSQPGKIMHETRKGEMAVLRELPFGRYYGGVDTTPLYIYLACAYAGPHRRHGLHRRAVAVAVRRGRLDGGGGQAERQRLRHLPARRRIRASPTRAGRTASIPSSMPTAASRKGPIALVEVQGYVFAAYRGLAELAGAARGCRQGRALDGLRRKDARRRSRRISGWRTQASTRWRIDGDGQPCEVRTSNAGHLLYVGLPSPERAQRVTDAAAGRVASIPAGACGRWPTTRSRSTRCPTTTARSGRTTRRSAPPAWRATASATASSG